MCLQSGVEEFKLGDVRIWLPKENIREVWRKTKKIVDIYLEMGAEMEERERERNLRDLFALLTTTPP